MNERLYEMKFSPFQCLGCFPTPILALSWYISYFLINIDTIESKLRLEKSLENERSDSKQKIEKLQSLLDQEKEERRKDKEEASSNFDSLNERFNLIQVYNKYLDIVNWSVLNL